ncbi:hypothetical protein MJD09_05540 [bacterium]|nr:hypothetical protein [bacterium]
MLAKYPSDMTVLQVLETQAETLFSAINPVTTRFAFKSVNWLPDHIGASWDEIMAFDFSLYDAKLTVAREHGFDSWQVVVANGKQSLDVDFENAVDAVVSGKATELEALLRRHPELARVANPHTGMVRPCSTMLLLTVWRPGCQQVPSNAAEIARIIIAGALKNDTPISL